MLSRIVLYQRCDTANIVILFMLRKKSGKFHNFPLKAGKLENI
jgi:hypothetical protein